MFICHLLLALLVHPGDGGPHRLAQHGSTGAADGRQSAQSPVPGARMLQLTHEQTVRQHDQVHVPGLALAIAELTVAHPQLLLAVSMKGLRTCPALPIRADDPRGFPKDSIRYQDLPGFGVLTSIPDDDDADFVLHTGNMQTRREEP